MALAAQRLAKLIGELLRQMNKAAAAHAFEMQVVVAMLAFRVLVDEVPAVAARQLADRAALGQCGKKAKDRAFSLAVGCQAIGNVTQRQSVLSAFA